MRGPQHEPLRPADGVVDVPRLAADLHATTATKPQPVPLHHRLDLTGGEIDRLQTPGCGDQELVALGRVSILMKIEADAPGQFGEPHHAVAGQRLDPFPRHLAHLCGSGP